MGGALSHPVLPLHPPVAHTSWKPLAGLVVVRELDETAHRARVCEPTLRRPNWTGAIAPAKVAMTLADPLEKVEQRWAEAAH
jgi:hypothetical protein